MINAILIDPLTIDRHEKRGEVKMKVILYSLTGLSVFLSILALYGAYSPNSIYLYSVSVVLVAILTISLEPVWKTIVGLVGRMKQMML